MKITVKNIARLSLFDLLKRRKTKLEFFVSEMMISSYDALVSHCEMLGVQPPTLEECSDLFQAKTQILQQETVTSEAFLSEPEVQEYSSLQEEENLPLTTKEKKKKKTLKSDDTV